ncbi:MAG: endopeptidase La [Bacteroidales bacterium]|nr:endopeptidase La [Bacteroidales bacterium]MBR0539168.1 endopeptidase La [Bacteroidales bacterium]
MKLDEMLLDALDSNSEFIPVLTIEDDRLGQDEGVPEELPILPLRNSVLFPGVVIPITVGRDKSVRLVKEYYRKRKAIGVVAQRDSDVEEPTFEDLYKIGTVAQIIKTLQMPDGNLTVIIQGKRRFELDQMTQSEPFIKATVLPYLVSDEVPKTRKFNALVQSVKELAIQIIAKSQRLPEEASFAIKNIDSPIFLMNFVASNVEMDLPTKQMLLESTDINQMATDLLGVLTTEQQMLELKQQIQSKVRVDIDKQQREYFLNQQLRTIQEELGGTPNEQDVKELVEKAKNKKWSEEVATVFDRELKKLERTNPQAAEYGIQLNYLQYLVDLPWNEYTKDNFDLKRAQRILDADHYGLEKVKDRIVEHLAVLRLRKDMKSPILCLVGPPGVGKTSLGKSIARALNRKYVRMSLGGVRDESELRGHRKTYIGAMPGRIIQNLRKVKSGNPVFVLDEIDKVSGNNISGDPQAALLEILDPEQNNAFYDNFIELDYDLSKVLFIATANNLATIHPALRDRMEIIDLSGYLREEKYEIAKRHLIPKQMTEHGLDAKQISLSKDIVMHIIDDYTREAGVRNLERRIGDLMRYRAKQVVAGDSYVKRITSEDLREVLGVPMHHDEDEVKHTMPGVATGLAWTQVGGEILSIEVSLSRGGGHLSLTGNLGEVMKESATIAYEFIKAHASLLNINPDVFDAWNVHVHIPEGATPKDGPSAGITMLTALTSAFTQRKVKSQLAMTGEITLRGRVLPVGGVKEKILAAKRNGVTDLILSVDNEHDIKDIKEDYVEGLKFHYVENMMEVLDLALEKEQDTNDLDYNKYLNNLHSEVIGFKVK